MNTINTPTKVHSSNETLVQLYNIVEEIEGEQDVILESNLTLSEAEDRLCWHINHDADAYIQDVV